MTSNLAERVKAEAFHNLDARFGPYELGHRVVRVFVGKFDDPGPNDLAVCNTVYELLNMATSPSSPPASRTSERWPTASGKTVRSR